MGSVECIKPENSTTFKPHSQNQLNTRGQVGRQNRKLLSYFFSAYQPPVIVLEIWPILYCSFGDFCVWDIFKFLNIVKISQKFIEITKMET